MCDPDIVDSGDGTFAAYCYCGWSMGDFDSAMLADAHAEDHGRDFWRRESAIETGLVPTADA